MESYQEASSAEGVLIRCAVAAELHAESCSELHSQGAAHPDRFSARLAHHGPEDVHGNACPPRNHKRGLCLPSLTLSFTAVLVMADTVHYLYNQPSSGVRGCLQVCLPTSSFFHRGISCTPSSLFCLSKTATERPSS